MDAEESSSDYVYRPRPWRGKERSSSGFNSLPSDAFAQSSYHSHRQNWTSEDYALESKAADDDEWITFDPKEHGNDIDHFLENNKPSVLHRSNNVGWIYVESPSNWREEHEPDTNGLEDNWEMLKKSGRPINYQTVLQLSKAHKVTLGKWLMHIPTGFHVDYAWEKIAKATVKGQLGCAARVSPFDSSKDDYKHLVCVYNVDCTDRDQIYDVENRIRVNAGIKCRLQYKPEVYSYVGIYRKNEWGIKPTIYESIYELHRGSTIISCFENDP